MRLRDYKSEDSAIICKWLRSEEEFFKWSADRFNKFPMEENDIDQNYAPQIKSGRFIPLTAVDENGVPVGHFIIRYPREDDDSTVRFGFVVIAPDIRGKGIGRELIRLGIEYVRKNLPVRRIDLGVFADNDNARRCYEACGFKEYSRRICELPVGIWECIDMELYL